jgi:hypothetical protein
MTRRLDELRTKMVQIEAAVVRDVDAGSDFSAGPAPSWF